MPHGLPEAGESPKNRAAGFARLRVDDVVRVADAPAGEQGVSAEPYPFAVGVVGERLEAGEVLR
jgi:hypothetical protein